MSWTDTRRARDIHEIPSLVRYAVRVGLISADNLSRLFGICLYANATDAAAAILFFWAIGIDDARVFSDKLQGGSLCLGGLLVLAL